MYDIITWESGIIWNAGLGITINYPELVPIGFIPMDFTKEFKFLYDAYKIKINYMLEITGLNFYCDPDIMRMDKNSLARYFELFIGPEFEKLKRMNINKMILSEKFRRPYPYSYTGLYVSNFLSAPQYVG